MTVDDLLSIRRAWGISQTEMADLIGLSLRAYQDIENRRSAFRRLHVLAVERVSLSRAALKGDTHALLESIRLDLLRLTDKSAPD